MACIFKLKLLSINLLKKNYIKCYSINQTYRKFVEGKFPSSCTTLNSEVNNSNPKSETEQLEVNLQSQSTAPRHINSETSSMIRAQKRNTDEVMVVNPKKYKLAEPSTSHGMDCTEDDKNKKSLFEKTMTMDSLTFGCNYCETWNNDINKIFIHWEEQHHIGNDHPFLFCIEYRKNRIMQKTDQFQFTKLTNFQLKILLEMKITAKHYNSSSELETADNDNIQKQVSDYIYCGYKDCEEKMRKYKFLSHIEMHAKDIRARNGEKEFKKLLRRIYSKTKVVFVNGMVLIKYNLLSTNLGDSMKFEKFIESLLSIKMEPMHDSAEEVIVLNQTNGESTPTVSSTTATTITKSSESEPFDQLLTKLKSQNERCNTISIIGIQQKNGEILEDIFHRICLKLKIDIFKIDILEIFRSSERIIGVKFRNNRKKDEILNCGKLLYTSDISNSFPRKLIQFRKYMTKFYASIDNHLREALKDGKIYSFDLTKDGFLIKKTKNSRANVILSIEQFEEMIYQLNSTLECS